MKATAIEIARLLERNGIAPIAAEGTNAREAARGGREGNLCILHTGDRDLAVFTIGEHRAEGAPPHDFAEALPMIEQLRAEGGVPNDASFEHMLADLLVKATKLYEESGATKFELASLHLHPTSYHIGEATLIHDKPLHVTARLEPHSHDRRAVFDHRHGDALKNPK